ncbi:MAG: hypothetical protein CMF22_10425 [Idiomarinaceae bacterium]|nr:hypothetical protein [Idiomarinaceae bacterium]MBG23856.1 hypothetical protein [Idiomarinaceae bacterium]
MTNINFYSRYQMKRMIEAGELDPERDVVISINDTPQEYKEMFELLTTLYDADNKPEAWQNYTCLMFNDDEGDFSELQARVIKTFVDNHGVKKNYHIHCFAGVSRSGAVAKWINEYYDQCIMYLDDYMGYNRHVFNELHKLSGTSLLAYYEQLEKQGRMM